MQINPRIVYLLHKRKQSQTMRLQMSVQLRRHDRGSTRKEETKEERIEKEAEVKIETGKR